MSSVLSVSACDTDASLSDVVPRASRFSATKLFRSPTTSFRFLAASATSVGLFVSSPVTDARFWFSRRISSVLSRNADTRVEMFLTLLNMSELWSASAETACDNLTTASRIAGPWPRKLSAAVSTKAPSALTPWGSVGCSNAVSRSSCWRKASNSTGTAVRSSGMIALFCRVGPPV